MIASTSLILIARSSLQFHDRLVYGHHWRWSRPAKLRSDEVAVRTLHLAARIDIVVVALAEVHLAVEEEVNVIGRQTGVERRGQLLTRHRGSDQAWGNDDDEVGFL